MTDLVIGLALLATTLGSGALVYIGLLGLLGKLRPNRWAGIRTSFTHASEENWYDTHKAAGPVFVFGGIFAAAVSLAFVPFALAGKLNLVVGVAVLVLVATVILLTALLGLYAGTSFAAARATAGDKQ